MKKLILIVIGALVISACANKDVYFNGSEGSHSGMKFDKRKAIQQLYGFFIKSLLLGNVGKSLNVLHYCAQYNGPFFSL